MFMPSELQALSVPALAGTLFGFFAGLTLLATGLGFALERLLPRRKIFDVPLFPGQYRFELLGNAIFLAILTTTLTVSLRAGIVRLGPDSFARSGLSFLALMFGFQAYYWGLHRAMHTRALVRFHRWHHRSHVTTPLTGQSMSPVEACGWMVGYVGLPWAFSLLVPIGFWGWAGYLAFNVAGNVVGHSNVEPTLRTGASRAASTFLNPYVYHSLHHARWTGHYSFQAALMDRLMGTEWNDWRALYDRIVSGQPLKSLKERGSAT
jgi:sterol desaturase/sphingolipid hydroxylase (fatty acid hydroxylase superfamily)